MAQADVTQRGQAGREILTQLRISKIGKQRAAVLGNNSVPWEVRSLSTRWLHATRGVNGCSG